METAILSASDGWKHDFFGSSVDISGNTIVVGASRQDFRKGAVYVFEKSDSVWTDTTETAKLTISRSFKKDEMGHSVSILENTIAVGATGGRCDKDGHHDGEHKAAGSDDLKCCDIRPGVVYVFQKSDSGWVDMSEAARLTASDYCKYINISYATDIWGDVIVTTAKRYENGLVYIYEKPDSGWVSMTETAKLTSSIDDIDEYQARSVNISDSIIVVGLSSKDSDRDDEYDDGHDDDYDKNYKRDDVGDYDHGGNGMVFVYNLIFASSLPRLQ